MGEAWDDATDEFFEAAFGFRLFEFRFAEGLFPCGGEAGSLFAHDADSGFHHVKMADFVATRFLLEGVEVDAEVFVLLFESVNLFREAVVACSIDLELRIEMVLQIATFIGNASLFSFLVADGAEA